MSGLIAVFLAAVPYVDGSPSLGKIVQDATHIAILRVEKVNEEKRVVLFSKIADLKGALPAKSIPHQITDGWHPREPKFVLNWAEPGKRAIFFANETSALTCLGDYWYQSSVSQAPWWAMTHGRPDLAYAYSGSADRLERALAAALAGKESVVTAVKHEESRWSTYSNVAFREVMSGRENPLWRLRFRLDMPPLTMNVSRDPRWIVGPGAAGVEDVPALVAALRDKEPRVRAEAAADLGTIGPPAVEAAGPLREGMKDPEPLVRIRSAEALLLIAPGDDSATALIAELKSRDPKIRQAAARAIGRAGPGARAAVPLLGQALRDSNGDVRWAAAEALGFIGAEAEPAVKELLAALKDSSLRVAAVDALGRIGPKARSAVPSLAALLRESGSLRSGAALALARIGGEGARAAVPHIVPGLKSPEERTRWDATIVLWTMGRDAQAAVPALVEAIEAGNEMAVDALSAVDLKAAVPLLVKRRLTHPDASFRKLAADSLGNAGKDAASAVPALTEALKDPDEGVRSAAAEALKKIRVN